MSTRTPYAPVLAAEAHPVYESSPAFAPIEPEPSPWVVDLDANDLIPEGRYPALVARVEHKYAQSGTPMLNFGYRIQDDDPDAGGRYVNGNFFLTDKAIYRLKAFLKSCGMTGQIDLGPGETGIAQMLIDHPVWIDVEFYNDRNGDQRNGIKFVTHRDPDEATGDVPF